jgi:hypothetical protein
MIDPLWLGCLAVLAASIFMALRSMWFFKRKLSLEEALSVCWVAWTIYMGAFVIYIGLKLPLGLSRSAHAPCYRGSRLHIDNCNALLGTASVDWKNAVPNSILALFTLTLGVVGAIYFFR